MNQYLTHYSELDDASIRAPIFARISFDQGIPAIILDFVSYLTGAFESEQSTKLTVKAMKMLYERVQPIVYREPLSSALASAFPAGGDKSPYMKKEGNLLHPDLKVKAKLSRKNKIIPPFKDVPAEIYDDGPGLDQDPLAQMDLEAQIRKIRAYLGEKKYLHFERLFRKIAEPTPKLGKKAHPDDRHLHIVVGVDEEMKVSEMSMTEKTLTEGFERAFGARCDIFAKLIYMKTSRKREHARCSIVDLYRVFEEITVNILDSSNSFRLPIETEKAS